MGLIQNGQPAKLYKLYFWKPLVAIYVGVPALFILAGLICFGAALAGKFGTDGPPAWVFVFVVAFGIVNGYMWVRFPYLITVQEDGTIQFRSIFRTTTISPLEIKSIQAKPYTLGFIDIAHQRGSVHLLSQFDGLHELLTTLKTINPSMIIRDC